MAVPILARQSWYLIFFSLQRDFVLQRFLGSQSDCYYETLSKFSLKANHFREIPYCVVQAFDYVTWWQPGRCYLDLHQTVIESQAENQ